MSSDRIVPLVGQKSTDFVVLGAGVGGLLVALELSRRGKGVVVLEPTTVAAFATGAELGHVSTGLSAPYTKAVARHGRETARALWEWHRESHDRMVALLPSLRDDCGYRKAGGFRLALSREQAMDLAESEDLLRDDGFSGEFLDHHMLEARFDVRGFAGAYWVADDAEVEATVLLRALAAALHEKGGFVHEASTVTELSIERTGVRVRTARGEVRAGAVVLAQEGQPWSGLSPVLRTTPTRGLVLDRVPAGTIPQPARTADGAAAWRSSPVDFRAVGLAEGDKPSGALEAFLASHLVAPPAVRGHRSGMFGRTADGLPLIGTWPDVPVAAVLGLAETALAWTFVAAPWVAEALCGGTDPTPSILRAARVAWV